MRRIILLGCCCLVVGLTACNPSKPQAQPDPLLKAALLGSWDGVDGLADDMAVEFKEGQMTVHSKKNNKHDVYKYDWIAPDRIDIKRHDTGSSVTKAALQIDKDTMTIKKDSGVVEKYHRTK